MKYKVTYSQNGDARWPITAKTEIVIDGQVDSIAAVGTNADDATDSLIKKIRVLLVPVPEPREIEV